MSRKTTIVVDTREQLPLDFSPFPDVRTVRRKYWPGDYSIAGAGARIFAVERKSVADLVGTMKQGYSGFSATSPKRFDCTLLGLSGIIGLGGIAFVLVEPDVSFHGNARDQIEGWHYRSEIQPAKILAFCESIRRVWRVPVRFADSREHAAEIVVAAAKFAEALQGARKNARAQMEL